MTEIGNTGAVVSLRSDPVRSPTASSGASRFSAEPVGQEKGTDVSVAKVEQVPGDEPVGDPLEKAAKALQEFLPEADFPPKTKLRIDRDEETGRFIYRNVDKETGEVIKQFPPDKIIEFISYYRDLEGIVVDDKA
ncbi:MAG: flagellar protein FlaG [Alphaproteobacteria bacterium]|nr:MAG: flagellar protein FlaG [Alphaproteobacteria bacterium]